MSAITGIWLCDAISGSASASSCDGHATRTMSQPDAVSSAICCSVVLTSAVSVVHIDCTEIGASPPTSTLPTLILRLWRRGASTGGGALGIPRETAVMAPSLGFGAEDAASRRRPGSAELHRGDDVGEDQDHAEHEGHHRHGVGERQQLGAVDAARVGLAAHPGEDPSYRLVERGGD